ncbi:MAG: tRNA 2-thiouridine(34) synthase MnmA [Gammaproteobacteria bacterium]|nr:tRNA 2-thiouridine(34) synthase MnmA [Gammaproteobacteria bacterium]MYF01903.1 tRNA 2-thiouridine(34) synthase MnmA [Gammaproteobacteria bacterium]MYI76917.1 tRNA 2-thiouridine(34) synthase MnmA [Gammaproteobacteria bacterium]
MRRTRVILGLSGGVDSAVAAKLLLEQGFEVVGVFMKNWDEDDGTEYCTAETDFADAHAIAEKLKFPLEQINFAHEYWERVFTQFLKQYNHGWTPNPDVLCNREIKFGLFLEYANAQGVELIATGHYARAETQDGKFSLHRGSDLQKDQTYFLSGVPRSKLSRCLFPLAELTKTEVRKIAQDIGISVHDKKDSTGICFIGERRFKDFLARYVKQEKGEIVDTNNRVVGEHIGLPYYTLGQRTGMGIGGRREGVEAPWFVMQKNQKTNQIVVTQHDSDLLNDELEADSMNWLVDKPQEIAECEAMVRYRQSPQPCFITFKDNHVHVRFLSPQRAITPGQYAVFYQDTQCLGSALINKVFPFND